MGTKIPLETQNNLWNKMKQSDGSNPVLGIAHCSAPARLTFALNREIWRVLLCAYLWREPSMRGIKSLVLYCTH